MSNGSDVFATVVINEVLDRFKLSEAQRDKIVEFLARPRRGEALVIQGPQGFGKTVLARALQWELALAVIDDWSPLDNHPSHAFVKAVATTEPKVIVTTQSSDFYGLLSKFSALTVIPLSEKLF